MSTGNMTPGDYSLAAQGAGGLISVIGAFAGASAQRASLRYQAEVANINAGTAARAAEAALMVGQHQAQASMMATANLKSTQTAHLAANGVDLGEGSAARTLASTDIMGKIDANTIEANAVRAAWGYRTQQTNYENDARMRQASAAAISPTLAAGTSLLTSATAVAPNWYSLNKAGGLDAFAQGGR